MQSSSYPYEGVKNDLKDINTTPPPSYTSPTAMTSAAPTAPAMAAPITSPPPAINVQTTTIGGGGGPFFGGPVAVGPDPVELNCPQCRCRIRTKIRHRSTAKTHIACLMLSWTVCCCCLPYCMDSCRNANHFCPMCGSFVGTYSS